MNEKQPVVKKDYARLPVFPLLRQGESLQMPPLSDEI